MTFFDVVTFGTATLDLFVSPKGKFDIERDVHAAEGRAIALPLEGKVEISSLTFTTGGGATNAAVTFARQGLKTACVCKIGSDIASRAVLSELEKEKVDTRFISEDTALPTGYSVILEVGRAGRTVLVYRGSSEKMSRADLSLPKIKARWFYLAPLGGEAAKLFPDIVGYGARHKIKLAADLSKAQIKLGLRRLAPVLNKLDILKINREEAAFLTGLPFRKEKEIFERLDRAVRGIVVVTDGPRGVKVSDGRRRWEASVFKEKKIIDRTGAGDAFGAAFVSVMAQRKRISPDFIAEAIRIASANATSVVEAMGAKAGILRSGQSRAARWRKLSVKITALSKTVNPYLY